MIRQSFDLEILKTRRSLGASQCQFWPHKIFKKLLLYLKKPQITSNKWVLSTQTNTYRRPTCITPPATHLIPI
jgi:hypothetical protein